LNVINKYWRIGFIIWSNYIYFINTNKNMKKNTHQKDIMPRYNNTELKNFIQMRDSLNI